MQISHYPPSVPSAAALRSEEQRSTSAGVAHGPGASSTNHKSDISPSMSSNKAPLVTIPENWDTIDAVTNRLQPMTLFSGSKIRANDAAHFSHSLPNQSFHAIRSRGSRLSDPSNSQSTRVKPKSSRSLSSSSKSHGRHQIGRLHQEDLIGPYANSDSHQQQLNAQRLTEERGARLSQSHGDEKDADVGEQGHSDQASEDSDSDSSDSSDGSRSGSRSHSDNNDENASSDDEDSGSNASQSGRSGSSSSYSSDGEDDSSSSSCCSSQVILHKCF